MKKSAFLLSIALVFPSISFASNDMAVNENTINENVIYYDYTFPYDINDYDDSVLQNTSFAFNAKKGESQVEIDNLDASEVYLNGKKVADKKEIDGNIADGKNYLDVLDSKDDTNVSIKASKEEKALETKRETLDKGTTDLLEKILDEEVKKDFAGGQISVMKDNKEIYNHNFGYKNNYYEDGRPIEMEKRDRVDDLTMFDLASNTKMYVTNYSLQKLVYEGKINLDDKVNKYFDKFKDSDADVIKGKNNITIRDILMHQAGFPADPQYHNEKYDKDDGIKNGKNDLYSQDRNHTLDMIFKTPLKYEPGKDTIYSDVDYMLLGFIVEKVTGMQLDEYFDESFVRPLGLTRTTFNPLENGFEKYDTAATELNGNTRDGKVDFNNIRRDTIWGEVHDEKAYYSMNGISGHAGLFSNASDLSKLANIMLNNGRYEDTIFWDKKTQDLFTKPKQIDPSYGLGWRLMGNGKYAWAFSNLASSKTYGHTGWTGTLTVIDPVENMVITLLTNKKNSLVLNNENNPNVFYSDQSLSAGYGAITTLLYKSLQESSLEQIIALSDELVRGKERLIRENDDYFNIGQINDYIALKNVNDYYKEKYKTLIEVNNILEEFKNADKILKEENPSPSQRVTSTLYSPNLKLDWNYNVYLPKNYDPKKAGGYPVLYMLHGLGGNHTNLLERFDSKTILDKVIKKTGKDMIVVFPDGFNSFYIDQNDGMQMEKAIMEDLIPYIDKTYNTRKSRNSRAIAGISMGGYGAARFALKYPEKFSKATLISPAVWYNLDEENNIRKNNHAFKETDKEWSDDFYKRMHPENYIKNNTNDTKVDFYIRTSLGDSTVPFNDVNKFVEALKVHNINTIFIKDSKDNEHNWNYWKNIAYDFYKWANESLE
ncbi:MAG: penicillin binding protein PBP4B [Anaerococcus sp.]|uniref:penicillin binding protein PBP4B n=1 Tax=Anaerococcus sp. TaxID=1872515 RepID=UPI0029158231|nr:penicillin binding protein PBP4B [Anaerococcus sp.]MDU7411014.1 penicillin binding protein PBP4B [Anaerococcus sp.]